MANTTIPNLPLATALDGSEQLEIVQAGTSKRATVTAVTIRTPNASEISNAPSGNISATNVQAALNELDSEKFPYTGGTITGSLTLGRDFVQSIGYGMTTGGDISVRSVAGIEGGQVGLYEKTNTNLAWILDVDGSGNGRLFTTTNNVNFTLGQIGGSTGGTVSIYTGSAQRLLINTSGDFQMGGANTVVDVNRALYLRQYTVATLPTVGTVGRLVAVSDANAPTYNATVSGGGVVKIPVYDNGTNWVCH